MKLSPLIIMLLTLVLPGNGYAQDIYLTIQDPHSILPPRGNLLRVPKVEPMPSPGEASYNAFMQGMKDGQKLREAQQQNTINEQTIQLNALKLQQMQQQMQQHEVHVPPSVRIKQMQDEIRSGVGYSHP